MQKRASNNHKVSRAGIVFPLLLIVFITELAVMEFFAPFISRANPLVSALIDAVALSLVCAVPLVSMLSGTNSSGNQQDPDYIRDRHWFILQLLAAVAVVEFVIMLVLPWFWPEDGSIYRPLLDASLATLILGPYVWWLVTRQQYDVLHDLHNSPLKSYVLLLGAVFALDLLEAELIPLIFPVGTSFPYRFYDAFCTTLFTAPFLWWLMVRPLQRAAQAERVRHDAIQSQVVDAIVNIDQQGIIVSTNCAAEETFGYDQEEIVGRPASILFCDELLAPESMQRLTGEREEPRQGTHEVVCHRKDGTPVALEISISRLLLQGARQFLVIMRDISVRKEMEQDLRKSETRFRQLFEQSEDAIIFFKPATGEVLDANATAELLFGYTRAELQAAGVESLEKGGESAKLRAFICGISQGGISILDRYLVYKNDGTEVIISIRGKLLILQEVEVVFCTFRDITQRVRLEEQSREIQAKLIQANKMTSLGLMVSGVAHEINNPNSFILANAQLLDKVWRDAVKVLREYYDTNGDFLLGGLPYTEMERHVPEMVDGIVDGTRRINVIIGDLKGFVRQDRRTTMREIDINATVQAAVAILQSQIVRYTERFTMELADSLPAVCGNNQQLGQVLINLLMNACQALPSTQCSISLRTSFDHEAGQVVIKIHDEGVGIPQELGRRIMDPFFTTKLDAGGTGLGLSISQSIIKEHDGMLEFRSDPGKGTTFFIRLPIPHPPAEEQS